MEDSEINSLDQKQISHANDWLSDHGQKDFDELKNLAVSATAESLERLHELADDNNISYNETTEPMDLAKQIYTAMGADPNTGVE